MPHKVRITLYALSVIGSAIISYWFFLRFSLDDLSLAEARAFDASPLPFLLYVLSAITCLWLGPQALAKAVREHALDLRFNLCCIVCAWCGAWMSHAIGDDAVGGAAMQYYWFGLALVWSFIVLGVLLAHRRAKPLVVRDWTIYAYALCLLPVFIVPGIPIWASLPAMDADDAMVTAVTVPFAGIFLAVHWLIFERLEKRRT